MSDQTTVRPAVSSGMTPVQGVMMLGAVVVVLAVFIAACMFLGLHDMWAGFLFLLCWASFEHAAPEKLFDCAAGAAFGLLLAWSMKVFPVWFGAAGMAIFVGLLLVVVYMQIMQWGKRLVNAPAMLYLTVGVIPLLNTELQFPSAFLVLGLAVVYFGGLLTVMRLFDGRKAATAQ